MGPLIVIGLAGAALLWYINRYNRQQEAAERRAFLERIAEAEAWVNSQDQLPEVTLTRMVLQRGERCFYAGPAQWFELRKKTKRVNYSGPVASVQIMKGLRYRAGSITPSIESETVLAQIDAGTLYITDKRLFFDGAEKNVTLRWNGVAAIAAFQGGFEVEKQTGKSPYLSLEQQPERAAAIATRAMLMGVGA